MSERVREERKGYIPTRCARCGEYAQYRRPDGALGCDSCQRVDEVPASTALAARPASAEPCKHCGGLVDPGHPCPACRDGSTASAEPVWCERCEGEKGWLNGAGGWTKCPRCTTPPAAAQDTGSGHRYTEYIVRDETGRDAYKADSDYLAVAWARKNASQLTGRVRLVIRGVVEHTQYMDAARAAGATDGK